MPTKFINILNEHLKSLLKSGTTWLWWIFKKEINLYWARIYNIFNSRQKWPIVWPRDCKNNLNLSRKMGKLRLFSLLMILNCGMWIFRAPKAHYMKDRTLDCNLDSIMIMYHFCDILAHRVSLGSLHRPYSNPLTYIL